ncbi:hypothetical protein SUDANB28_05908 [Streptomyces sp. enrichment culture]
MSRRGAPPPVITQPGAVPSAGVGRRVPARVPELGKAPETGRRGGGDGGRLPEAGRRGEGDRPAVATAALPR